MASHSRTIPFSRASTRELDFRIIINLFNIVTLILLIVAGLISVGIDSTIWDLIAIAGTAVSILWTTTATILLLAQSLKPRHHPAIDLTFDAISWLALWILGAFLVAQWAASEGLIMCSPDYNSYSDSLCRGDRGARKWSMNVAASVFMLVNGLIHLVFFGIACHRVKLWRRQQWGMKRESLELDNN